MNSLKALSPRLGLVIAGVALGLLARQVLGPPVENPRPAFSIDRPIADGLDLDSIGTAYVPVDLPLEKLDVAEP